MKAFFLWIHKWLGLISGIVVFILGITGCIYVFHDDLKVLVYPGKYYLSPVKDQKPLPLSQLISIAGNELPSGEKISRVDLYPAPGRTWIFRAAKTDENAFGHWNYQVYNKRVFVNPYSGKVQAVEDSRTEFFQVVLQMHMNLLLGKKAGHVVVGYSTVIFLVLLITGLVLWWPKKWSKRTMKQSFKLDFGLKWKRLNYDLHNILGFYSLLFALLIGITGLVFSFPEFKTFYTDTLNRIGSRESAKIKTTEQFETVPFRTTQTLDNALFYALENYPEADMMSIRLRDSDEEFHDIQIRLEKGRSGAHRWYYFNQKDGQISKVKSSEGLRPGDKLAALNYDIHVGSIGGWPTKILAFMVSLISASLPVTGFLVWWYKHKKTPAGGRTSGGRKPTKKRKLPA